MEPLKQMQEYENWEIKLNLLEVKRQVENILIVTIEEFGMKV
jgi:hypothetical protein